MVLKLRFFLGLAFVYSNRPYMPKVLTGFGLLLLTLAFGTPAMADTIGTLILTNCGNDSGCPGATYSFDITNASAMLKIKINSVPGSSNDLITAVDLGFTPSKNIGGLTLLSGPAGFTTTETGSLGNAGCGGNKGAFICSSGSGVPIVNGDTYTWMWSFDNYSGYTDLAGEVHIGANYGPANGLIVSCTINGCASPSPVPEPASLALLGTGLLALCGFARRRANKEQDDLV